MRIPDCVFDDTDPDPSDSMSKTRNNILFYYVKALGLVYVTLIPIWLLCIDVGHLNICDTCTILGEAKGLTPLNMVSIAQSRTDKCVECTLWLVSGMSYAFTKDLRYWYKLLALVI